MKQVEKLKQLNNLSFFDTIAIAQVTSLNSEYLYEKISRWIANDTLIQLKKGLYTTTTYYNNTPNKNTYAEFISNKLKYPSYLSLEYVLNKYQILTESVYTYTSITKKTPKVYSNDLGTFSYKNISEKLFTGFEISNKEGFDVATASKSKALFDYLYLKLYRKTNISKETIDELRLNLDEFESKDIQEFKKYCDMTKIQKFEKLPNIIFKKI